MSGRKSAEVNGLLLRGKNARDAGNVCYINKLHSAEQIFKDNQSEIDRIRRQLASEKFEIDADCRSEFPQESALIENVICNIEKANKDVSYDSVLRNFMIENKKIDGQLQSADKECDRIRERIKNKDWYCDSEYMDADRLLNTYHNLAKDKNRLAASIDQAAQNSSSDLIIYQNLETQMLQMKNAYKNLQRRAEEIVKLRKKSTEAKDYIHKMQEEIDPVLAKKHMKEEYERILVQIQQFLCLSDQQAVSQVVEMSEVISLFTNNLQQCHTRFLEKKAKAEAALNGNDQLLSVNCNFYFEPIDYFKNKEKAKKIPLLDYLAEYSDKTEIICEIKDGMKRAERMVAEEKYEDALEQASRNTETIERAVAYAVVRQEHLIENFYIARDIKKVMIDMGFETGAVKLDGQKSGWKITAKNLGGESIDFSQVFIKDDGEVKIDIDHKTVGNCPSKWKKICSALDHVGIYIEKIDMVDGTNVINRREAERSRNERTQYERTGGEPGFRKLY